MSFVRQPMTILPARNVRVWLPLLLLAATLVACGGDDGPAQVNAPPPPLEVTSGVFDVTCWMIFDTCNSTTLYNGTYDIQIDDVNFSMGEDWSGAWDPKTASGYGESEHESVTKRVCVVTTWTTVHVTFSSEDEFEGEIIFRQRVNGECDSPCLTSWGITGVRQGATP